MLERTATSDDLDFDNFKRKVRAAYGIDLNAYKRQQMERRLRANMTRCGASTFQQYYSAMQADSELAEDFLDRITINVSELFRNPDQFDTLRTKVMPELLAERDSLSVWSAGCSHGAEAYTLAMLLDELAPGRGHRILATDIDDRMLQRAREGAFLEHETRSLSRPRLIKYFERQPKAVVAKSVLKDMITFAKHNMLEDKFQHDFDLILCRNVVIYFTEETKTALYQRFFDSLRSGGYLFVGGTERIGNHAELGYVNHMPFFYGKPRVS